MTRGILLFIQSPPTSSIKVKKDEPCDSFFFFLLLLLYFIQHGSFVIWPSREEERERERSVGGRVFFIITHNRERRISCGMPPDEVEFCKCSLRWRRTATKTRTLFFFFYIYFYLDWIFNRLKRLMPCVPVSSFSSRLYPPTFPYGQAIHYCLARAHPSGPLTFYTERKGEKWVRKRRGCTLLSACDLCARATLGLFLFKGKRVTHKHTRIRLPSGWYFLAWKVFLNHRERKRPSSSSSYCNPTGFFLHWKTFFFLDIYTRDNAVFTLSVQQQNPHSPNEDPPHKSSRPSAKTKKREKNHSLERACSRSHGGTHRDDDDAHKTHSIPPRSFLIIKNQRVYLYLCVCLARIVDCSPRLINFLDRVALFFLYRIAIIWRQEAVK